MENLKNGYSVNPKELNKKLFLLIIPAILFMSVPYFILWRIYFWKDFLFISIDRFYLGLIILLIGIVLHELIHGLSWCILSKNGIKALKFGISARSLTPYCHFKRPIRLIYYILGSLMPAVILGLIPVILSWFNGNTGFLIFGIVFFFASGSDIVISLKLIKLEKNKMVLDFPDKPGCIVLD